MKRVLTLVVLLFVLLAACSAHADRYILHSPGRGQLKSEEAVAIAKEYLLSLCHALQDYHLPAARSFSKDYQFGPGWQWEVDTEDDVWVLPMPDAYAVVHGTTGEVLDWRFTYPTQENWYVRYENVMPEKMDHAAAIERAIQLAEDKAGDEKEWTRDMLYANALFSYKEDWRVSKPEGGVIPAYPIPLWEVDLSYYVPGENQARFVAGYMLDEDGNILAERDSETRILK